MFINVGTLSYVCECMYVKILNFLVYVNMGKYIYIYILNILKLI